MKENQNIVLVNDRFVPAEQAAVSIFDRGFMYGDGLFEAVRVCDGRLFRWNRHMLRLRRGANFLHIKISSSDNRLRELAMELIRLNGQTEAILRLTFTRGVSARGYSPATAAKPTLVMTIHPLPETDGPSQWRVSTASLRLHAGDPLASVKSCNRLLQVLARAEADAAGCDEALLLNDGGHAVELSSANLFWVDNSEVATAPLGSGILPGITRSVLFEVCEALGNRVREQTITREELLQAEGAFASLSSFGVVEIVQIDEVRLNRSDFVPVIRDGYEEILKRETVMQRLS